ncbi:rCG23189, isoform CRA_b [Rattus norvegicus]|uniref:RCG23189, isoform CRA_b n=1 Tax=Rattus norvegicus TaxID=10116 RepID=A6JQ93_RAT|nr:rCG23189, isoform CRA_b [Rattus norvegicus]
MRRLCLGVCSSQRSQSLHQRLHTHNTHSFKAFCMSMLLHI